MAIQTTDRAVDVFTVAQIGRTQELTPEGFLLCRDVPLARIGEMLYLPAEIGNGVAGGADGIARVTRGPDELFRPDTIASILGKDVVDEHPDEDVKPANWREVAVGVVLNPHPGEGPWADVLLADLLIKDADAIAAVQGGKREVSCGYECDYVDDGEGRGRQLNIFFNHVALVKNGRCGPRCSIGDNEMTTPTSLKDKILAAFKTQDKAALDAALATADEDGGGEGETGTNDAATGDCGDMTTDATADEAPPWFQAYAKSTTDRMTAIEDSFKAFTEGKGAKDAAGTTGEQGPEHDPGTNDAAAEAGGEKTGDAAAATADAAAEAEKDRTDDSADLADAFQDVVTRAEILAPGIKLATYDSASSRQITMDRMCALRRRALVTALDGEHADFVTSVAGGADVATMTCDAVTPVFIAASELAKRANSAPRTGFVRDSASKSTPPSLADINAANRAFWAGEKQ